MKGLVYLVHFDRPYKHASHYIGWSRQLEARLAHHRAGRGSTLMRAVSEAGIPWEVVRIWPDADRNFERRLKNMKNAPRLCPICSGEEALGRGREITG